MALPDDVLAGVLRRLPPSALAAARCVCKDWRAAVDARRLLRADLLLPRSVRGVFLAYHDLDFPAFLSSPSAAGPRVSASLHLLPGPGPDADADASRRFATVVDHCSGLLLYRDPRGLHVAEARGRPGLNGRRRARGGGAREAGQRRTVARGEAGQRRTAARAGEAVAARPNPRRPAAARAARRWRRVHQGATPPPRRRRPPAGFFSAVKTAATGPSTPALRCRTGPLQEPAPVTPPSATATAPARRHRMPLLQAPLVGPNRTYRAPGIPLGIEEGGASSFLP
ncbi:hypothetical protein ACP70R_021298 [Stipagrostis hirtigluma subsp. patula]